MSRLKLALPSGLATALGALPGVPAAQAAKLIGTWLPMLRSAPMIPAVRFTLDADAAVSDVDDDDQFGPFREFLESLEASTHPITLSLVGPVTTQLRLMAEGMDAAVAGELSLAGVRSQIDQMLSIAREALPGASLLVMLEEPSLANSMHPTFPLQPGAIEQQIRSVLATSRSTVNEQTIFGVHVNGRADWAMLVRTGITVLGAPLTGRLESAADEIRTFLDAGGFIAWGAVPTDEPLGSNSDRLWKRLTDVWATLASHGLDPMLLREHSIITPSADLANFGLAQAEQIIRLTVALSERVTTQITGARLSIGA